MTQIFATLQQIGAYGYTGLSRFVSQIRYHNIHELNVRQMFQLCEGVCLITQET